MNRYNSELPQAHIVEDRVNYLAPRFLLGYLFLLCTAVLAITLIYQLQYGSQASVPIGDDNGGQVCIQVITSARNIISGEIREFPTPCDVPQGWEPVPADETIAPDFDPATILESEWELFESDELGIRFKYPAQIFRDLKLELGNGETFASTDSPETVQGRSFGGNYKMPMNETESYGNWVFLFTGVSDDFQTNREGGWTDTTGYAKQDGRYYFRYINGSLMDLDQEFVTEIRTVNATGIFLEPKPFPRDDRYRFQPYVNEFGAVFNLTNESGFNGASFTYNVANAQNDPALLDAHRPIFEKMMKSVEIY